jgi:chemotaxis signal transduction protein
MSDSPGTVTDGDRLLTFEVNATVYALPIAAILEVAELNRITCVPGLPIDQGGVMNWSGEALPIVASDLLFGPQERETPEPVEDEVSAEAVEPTDDGGIVSEHVLVVSDQAEGLARLGVPIDRVIGLVDGGATPVRSQNLIQQRRPIDGRVVSVLDPRQLVARAEQVIQKVAA